MKERTNRNLLLTFLLGVVLCASVCLVDVSMLLFATVAPFFCLQLLLLRVTKKPFLRLIPVLPIVLMLAAAGYYWLFGKGWDTLAALIFGLLSIAPAVGCIAAGIVYRFSGRLLTRKWLIAALVALGCGLAWMGQELCWAYWDTAFLKTLSFVCCLGLYLVITGDRELLSMFHKPDRESLKRSAPLTIGVFAFLLGGYGMLSPWLDLSAIPERLANEGTTAENFPLVAAYITLCNSLLEEIFFRGFAFLTLKRYASTGFAYGFSALTFALYHVSIMSDWFHPIWFVVFIAGLAVAGMLFDFFDRRGSLWNGWMVHAAANLAINLIGMRMFGLI